MVTLTLSPPTFSTNSARGGMLTATFIFSLLSSCGGAIQPHEESRIKKITSIIIEIIDCLI
ncbi:MAG: hypothetical protein EF806_04845 [Candidatus Methanoliparum thermophilum]|uniref:Uncharacterized protein n=1 Tax=Methanoliparum thermophilum TaxID=2491083 RepID=A0A520KRL8_METT2|nr:MAG: hypothetical protein EF806_04845 [Candidatus Methanoliparum thermophilum]